MTMPPMKEKSMFFHHSLGEKKELTSTRGSCSFQVWRPEAHFGAAVLTMTDQGLGTLYYTIIDKLQCLRVGDEEDGWVEREAEGVDIWPVPKVQ